MKKVRYVAKMVVEFDVDDEYEKGAYPNGLNQAAIEEEMKSDVFPEIFTGELKSFEAEGFIIEDEEVTATHKESF